MPSCSSACPALRSWRGGSPKPLVTRSEAEQGAVAAAAGVAVDLVAGLRVLKGLGTELAGSARYRRASRSALAGRVHAATFTAVYDAVTLAVSGMFFVAVTWLGAQLAWDGSIAVGELVASVGLAQFLVGPLARVAGIGARIATVRASAGRVADYLAAPAAVSDGRVEPGPVGAISFRGLSSGSLHAIDLDFAAGAWTGVVAGGADAAAMLDVLARRTDPHAGTATIDDVPFQDLRLAGLRRTVLVADHSATLFTGSIGENIALVEEPVLVATAADQVAASLRAGLDSQVGEAGRSLSGGQRQRVALARAIAADPLVLVLHDPTTAVDAVTEQRIATRLRDLRVDRTTIMVTTSPALLAVCDRVIVLRDCAVVGTGTHAELAADEIYRDLVLA